MRYVLLLSTCAFVSVISHHQHGCEYPALYDFPGMEDWDEYGDYPYSPPRAPPATRPPKITTKARPATRPPKITTSTPRFTTQQQSTRPPFTFSTESFTFPTPRPTPPQINSFEFGGASAAESVVSRIGEDMNSMQQTHMSEIYCLEVLDRVLSAQWQEDIDKLSVRDLGEFSTVIPVPEFSNDYSNPESEWIQEDGIALLKLDKCVRNMVSKVAPRMDSKEMACLNKIYPDYMSREHKTAKLMDMILNETSQDQLAFKSFLTYLELTELLFENKNIDALDAEVRAVQEDLLDFYIKTEEDKEKKIFIIEQECEWKNARYLREVNNDNARYQRFGQLIKSHVNRYLVSEILWKWVPGIIVPEFRFNLWNQARQSMEVEILAKLTEVQRERRDAQFLCTYAAELANKYYLEQRAILFDKMPNETISANLKTHDKYSYVAALETLLTGKADSRLSRVQVLVKEFKEGHYCLTNFFRLIENHQRYMIASTLTNEILPYGKTYCLVKEMSAGLINPRYCKCQGTFCEEFGLATIRSQRYQLNLLPNNTYVVGLNPDYKILALDELVAAANQRIAGQKFNTYWYRNQKNPRPPIVV